MLHSLPLRRRWLYEEWMQSRGGHLLDSGTSARLRRCLSATASTLTRTSHEGVQIGILFLWNWRQLWWFLTPLLDVILNEHETLVATQGNMFLTRLAPRFQVWAGTDELAVCREGPCMLNHGHLINLCPGELVAVVLFVQGLFVAHENPEHCKFNHCLRKPFQVPATCESVTNPLQWPTLLS